MDLSLTLFSFNDVITVINTATNTIMDFIPVGDSPNDIVFTPDGTRAYVTNFNDDNVQVIATATNTILGLPIPVGDGANKNAITPDGSRVYVTNFIDGSVSVIDTATNAVIGAPIPVGLALTGLPSRLTASGLMSLIQPQVTSPLLIPH